ncbi:MAG: hypothetical protein KME27_10605 [Lyngbya sp. HA4199-MV5]|jgi:hypothetical protein|nr:hypothetical protein [Lyngbya sp. HA4199-MV5]
MATIKLNTAAIEKAAQAAFRETCLLMGTGFTQSISDPKWDFPTTTKRYGDGSGGKRKTPHEVSSPRDIVDTGRLRASQQLDFVSHTEARYSWNVAYGLAILYGYTTSKSTNIPGRDWVKDGLERVNAQKVFATLLKSKLL